MQRGQIVKHRGKWRLRYWDIAIINGQKKNVHRAAFLAPIGKDYPTKRSVTALADRILAPLNAGQVQPESSLTVVHFFENFYLPHVKKELRPSTYKDYKKDVFEKHLKVRLGELRLRDFRTVSGQRMLHDIAASNPDVGHKTLLRIKAVLSGAFKHAKRSGFIDGENPMRDVSAPGKPQKFQGSVYTMVEIERIAEAVGAVDVQAFVAISVAAFTGLRLAELRALRWGDYDGETLTIRRTVWRTHIGDVKNPASGAGVPVIPVLKKILDEHHARVVATGKNCREDSYIFAGQRRGAPLNLANLVRRVIIPALPSTAADERGPSVPWRGWHSFRRGLATNLFSCGVQPRIIQQILRHASVNTTLSIYVQPPSDEARAAMQKIEDWMQNT